MHELKGANEVELRLGVSSHFPLENLTGLLKTQKADFPTTTIHLELEIASGERILQEGKVDIAIFGAPNKSVFIDYRQIDYMNVPFPRDSWEANPHFKQATQNWLGAHQMFRQLANHVRAESERYRDRNRDPYDYAAQLSYYGDALVRNRHGHHGWEGRSYFPELSAADPRFDAGLEILEKDHEALDGVLDRFTEVANRTIKLIHLDPASAYDEASKLHSEAEAIEGFLARHLSDEEELAVPIILHHRLRG